MNRSGASESSATPVDTGLPNGSRTRGYLVRAVPGKGRDDVLTLVVWLWPMQPGHCVEDPVVSGRAAWRRLNRVRYVRMTRGHEVRTLTGFTSGRQLQRRTSRLVKVLACKRGPRRAPRCRQRSGRAIAATYHLQGEVRKNLIFCFVDLG